MSICKPSCVQLSLNSDWVNKCNLTKRKGGICRILFLVCDPDLVLPVDDGITNPYSNLANWKYLLCNSKLFVTGPVLGQKPKGTFTKKQTQSCGVEEIVSGIKTVSWQDYNAEPDELLDYDFYEEIFAKRKFLKFGYVSTEDLVYLFSGDWDAEPDDVIEPTQNDNTYHDWVVTMSTIETIKPIKVDGLLAYLNSFNSQTTCYQ
jgi:hypothetical protein